MNSPPLLANTAAPPRRLGRGATTVLSVPLLLALILSTLAFSGVVSVSQAEEAEAQSGSRVCRNEVVWVEGDTGSCSSFWANVKGEQRTFNGDEITCEAFAKETTGYGFDICQHTSRSDDKDSNSCTKPAFNGNNQKSYRVYSSCVYLRQELVDVLGWEQTPTCGASGCDKSVSASVGRTTGWNLSVSGTALANVGSPTVIGLLGVNLGSTEIDDISITVTESSGCSYQKGNYLRYRVFLDFDAKENEEPNFDAVNVQMQCQEKADPNFSATRDGNVSSPASEPRIITKTLGTVDMSDLMEPQLAEGLEKATQE